MSSSDSEVPLLERAELPGFMEIPMEARQPLTILEHEFVNAEVELSKLSLFGSVYIGGIACAAVVVCVMVQ